MSNVALAVGACSLTICPFAGGLPGVCGAQRSNSGAGGAGWPYHNTTVPQHRFFYYLFSICGWTPRSLRSAAEQLRGRGRGLALPQHRFFYYLFSICGWTPRSLRSAAEQLRGRGRGLALPQHHSTTTPVLLLFVFHLRADSPESAERSGATQGPGARAGLTTTPVLLLFVFHLRADSPECAQAQRSNSGAGGAGWPYHNTTVPQHRFFYYLFSICGRTPRSVRRRSGATQGPGARAGLTTTPQYHNTGSFTICFPFAGGLPGVCAGAAEQLRGRGRGLALPQHHSTTTPVLLLFVFHLRADSPESAQAQRSNSGAGDAGWPYHNTTVPQHRFFYYLFSICGWTPRSLRSAAEQLRGRGRGLALPQNHSTTTPVVLLFVFHLRADSPECAQAQRSNSGAGGAGWPYHNTTVPQHRFFYYLFSICGRTPRSLRSAAEQLRGRGRGLALPQHHSTTTPVVLLFVFHLRADSPESAERSGATQGPGARAGLTTTPQYHNTGSLTICFPFAGGLPGVCGAQRSNSGAGGAGWPYHNTTVPQHRFFYYLFSICGRTPRSLRSAAEQLRGRGRGLALPQHHSTTTPVLLLFVFHSAGRLPGVCAGAAEQLRRRGRGLALPQHHSTTTPVLLLFVFHLRADSPESAERSGATQGPGARAGIDPNAFHEGRQTKDQRLSAI